MSSYSITKADIFDLWPQQEALAEAVSAHLKQYWRGATIYLPVSVNKRCYLDAAGANIRLQMELRTLIKRYAIDADAEDLLEKFYWKYGGTTIYL